MLPFRIPLFLILLFPIAEIFAFVEIGGLIGGWQTVLWVILAAMAGGMLLRLHGIATMRRVQSAMMRGELPARAMFDGALLFFAAILLIIPGFISDAIALLLLLPPTRWLLLRMMMRRVMPFPPGHEPNFRRPDTIEGEYRREDEQEEKSYLDKK
ncbi:MAG TPA: FxsA family protein [Gammaproteobacteria bacterium]